LPQRYGKDGGKNRRFSPVLAQKGGKLDLKARLFIGFYAVNLGFSTLLAVKIFHCRNDKLLFLIYLQNEKRT
jgi:hypothetical protein